MNLFPMLYLGGFVVVLILSFFEPEEAEFSPSMALTSVLLVALLLRVFIRVHS